MKNKGVFNGFKAVFSFTAQQTIKGKGFKAATVGLFLLIFAIMAAVNVIIMYVTKDDKEPDIVEPSETIEFEIDDIYVFGSFTFNDIKDEDGNNVVVNYDNIGIEDTIKEKFNASVKVYQGEIKEELINKSLTDEQVISFREEAGKVLADKDNAAGLLLYIDDENDYIVELLCKDWENSTGASEASYEIGCKIKEKIIKATGLKEEYIQAVNREYMFNVTKAGEEENIAAFLIKMLAPMVICLILYMMVLINGQSITKGIMSEKTSKLMETLLTSTSPYGVIAGKVFAMALIAIGQMLLWILAAVMGFVTGNEIAKAITPGFVNPINEVLDIIREGAGSAFTVEAVIIAVVFMIVGFFMYCVLAAFAASFASKADDMSNVSSIFQLPVIAAFLVVYLAPVVGNDILTFVSRYVPFMSPFGIPADVLVGNVSIGESIIALLLVIVTTIVLVIATGKVYKDRVFNK